MSLKLYRPDNKWGTKKNEHIPDTAPTYILFWNPPETVPVPGERPVMGLIRLYW